VVPMGPRTTSSGQKIEARNLTKRYGTTLAVDDLSFDVNPGLVTGFIGPNGSGKTMTMRLILGLDNPTSGQVTVGGKPYRDLPAPLREVGALIIIWKFQAMEPNCRSHSRRSYRDIAKVTSVRGGMCIPTRNRSCRH
jgi:ABC-type branched-subunit amino acid transport system ATPase component